MSNKERILEVLTSGRRLCDDCLSDLLGIKPRQGVNQVCRTLRDKNRITRLTEACQGCTTLKITNAVAPLPSNPAQTAWRAPSSVETMMTAPLVADMASQLIMPPVTVNKPSISLGQSELAALVSKFVENVVEQNIEIYNEFSLQHELGHFLRHALPGYAVQFERNVRHFSASNFAFTKRELDIAVFSKDRSELKYAIELKYPRNGQHPETMFSFCKDIAFAEELKIIGFARTALLIFADDPLFYRGASDGIYGFFRSGRPITGRVEKPTGSKNEHVTIKGSYVVEWLPVDKNTRYALIEI